jgi:hypothetical protein
MTEHTIAGEAMGKDAQEEACMAEAPLKLKIALGKHAHVQPLKDGRVTSDRLDLTFVDYDPLPKAFRNSCGPTSSMSARWR